MINKVQAEELYAQLLLAASDEITTAVLQLHAPQFSGSGPFDWPHCSGCVGTIQGDSPTWPDDCDTTRTIAPYLHVDIPK